MAHEERFDVVIVGSGFGGSVMAYRTAAAKLSVCLLERGKPYPPGSFPRSPRDMAANFWDPSEGGHGLYQAWASPGIEAVASAGLGGGSLIYANVLIRKDERWFVQPNPVTGAAEDWPVTRTELDLHYERAEQVLAPQRYPLDVEPYASTPKTLAFRGAAQRAELDWSLPSLAVTFSNPGHPAVPGEPIAEAEPNLHGRPRYTCRLVGECDVGCNFGSKNTLDFNYLTMAQREGALLRTRCEVRSFGPRPDGGFTVWYVEHSPEDEGHKTNTGGLEQRVVTCDRLVLSAGTFGSTDLLLKNHASFPLLSKRLGTRLSGNGDLLGFIRRPKGRATGGRVLGLAPSLGPVITSTIRVADTVDGGDGPGYYIQEGGLPGFAQWALEAADIPGEAIRAARFAAREVWGAVRHTPKSDLGGEISILLGGGQDSDGLMILLGMGRDTPNGVMSLRGKWLELASDVSQSKTYFDRVKATMARLAHELDAEFEINPLWYLRKVITVHGLGGCPMGRNPDEGVVDSHGQVFNYPGLFIADGSVMPGPVGPNPSLTIAALSDRFADALIDQATHEASCVSR
jgi:cholesterol oxidase